MKVKVCGLTNRENIREVVACKADFLGLVFYPSSPRYVNDKINLRFLRTIPPYIYKVGVFVNESPETLISHVTRYGLDFVQLHGEEEPALLNALKSKRIGIIKAFRMEEHFNFQILEPYLPSCDFVLFDTQTDQYGGSGQTFNWSLLEKYPYSKPFFLSGGIAPEHASEISAIRHPMLYGVDINSRFEISPGLKDVFKVGEFIRMVKPTRA